MCITTSSIERAMRDAITTTLATCPPLPADGRCPCGDAFNSTAVTDGWDDMSEEGVDEVLACRHCGRVFSLPATVQLQYD